MKGRPGVCKPFCMNSSVKFTNFDISVNASSARKFKAARKFKIWHFILYIYHSEIKFLKKIPYDKYYHRDANSNYEGFSSLDYKGNHLGSSLTEDYHWMFRTTFHFVISLNTDTFHWAKNNVHGHHIKMYYRFYFHHSYVRLFS